MLNGNESTLEALHIVIVGAGIGGLSAAIALRQQGHRITLLEQSRFSKEIGAAIHVTPNCYGILQRFGLRVEDIGGVELVGVDYYGSNSEPIAAMEISEGARRWQHPWMLTHRVNLHNALKDIATTVYHTTVKTSSRVTNIDCEQGVVTCENGEMYEGDLIVGADGVHSVARDFICNRKILPYGTGKSAFRFLIPSEALRKDPDASFFMDDGRFKSVNGPIKKLVGYPCNNNSLMNCLFIVPTVEVDELSAKQGVKDQLLQLANEFGPGTQAVLSHIDPEWLNVWELLDMEPLPTWSEGRLVLLGDSAHPFLPWLGQGGAMAIEDAVSLATFLPVGTPLGGLKERLELYEKCRYERATRLQRDTRAAGSDAKDEDSSYLSRTQAAMDYSHGYDEWDRSSQVFRQHLWARSQYNSWAMPVGFGPLVVSCSDSSSSSSSLSSSKSPSSSNSSSSDNSSFFSKVQATIRFKTSGTKAQNLLPTSSFQFAAPDTLVHATWQYSRTTGMSQSSRCGLYLHGVTYKKNNGEEVRGSFAVVEFDASVDSVVNGRERYGLPRMHCEIVEDHDAENRRIQLRTENRTFAELQWTDVKLADQDTNSHSISEYTHNVGDILTYKYIPSLDDNEADLAYPVLIQDQRRSEMNGSKDGAASGKSFSVCEAHVSIGDAESLGAKSLRNIIARLAELPVYGVVGATVVEDNCVDDKLQAKKIDEFHTAGVDCHLN